MIARAAFRVANVADHWLLLPVLVIALLGTFVIQATTMGRVTLHVTHWNAETARQAAYLVVGVAVMLALARVDYRIMRRFAPLLYAGAMALLVATLVLGAHHYGARRWIGVGSLTVQPSEFAKLAMVVAGAALAADRQARPRALIVWAGALALYGGLIMLEPDLGTTLVLAAAWAAMILAWGLPWRLLGGLAIAALAVVPIVFTIAVPDYQRERIAVFVHPDRDPLGSGFTLRQVEVALGGGGVTGNGLLGGAHSALEGLATRTSDFAFAQVSEAAGLLGGLTVIVIFAIIAWRGLHAATVAPDRFGRLLAVGLTATITVQAAMHIAVNLRLFPATGITLPFISQGGSALVAMFAAIGILESIAARRPATPRELWTGERWS